jgi:hypothetical protein
MMNGQWSGNYDGTNPGMLVVDLDELPDRYQGTALAYDSRPNLPSSFVQLDTADKSGAFRLNNVVVKPLDPTSGDPTTWEAIRSQYADDVTFPKTANVIGALDGDVLHIAWQTDIGTHGKTSLPRSRAAEPSEYEPLANVTDWASFAEFVSRLEHRRYIFRGQSSPKRLRTAFHRTGRANLTRYINSDIPTLHKHLSSRTRHIFNLWVPDENGAFYNLAQHHGYPTPLLDWTFSPYVAAFFAFRSARMDASARETEEPVRIFVFDQFAWRTTLNQTLKISPARPHFSLQEFIAIENPRTIPQQSMSSVTNVDDVESHIRANEKNVGQYLRVIDLPRAQRNDVMRILSSMGITAGSLFPGLDGACEELRERFFGS